MSTSETALAVAKEAWNRWVAVDLEGFLAMWDPAGVWTNSGHSQISGESRGHDGIAHVAQIAFELSGGTLEARPIELAAAGEDTVLGYFQLKAQRPDAPLDQVGFQRIVVRDGKLLSLHNVYSDQEEFDTFFK